MNFDFQSIRGRCAAIIVLASTALIGGTGAAMTGNASSDTAQLIANENAWAKAALDGDADRMASFMADEYVELAWESATPTTPAHWTATSKKEWVDAVRRRAEVYKSVDLRNITVHLQGALAAVTGEYSQTGTNAGKDNTATGIYANTWVKRTGRWLVVESVFP
jgi:ketosteroid isomerase-like protein